MRANTRWGWAWIALCLSLAVHVADEAVHDFLAVYNPVARSLRERIPLLPVPVFTFRVWLAGLVLVILLLLLLSPFAFRQARWMRPLSYAFGVLMIGNALQHILSSLYLHRLMPGVLSSPLLLLAALFLLWSTSAAGRAHPRA
ncbi:MAG TPA: HXXEE domain-containing protein [Longimicrobiaceae bacterium]|nr:HXXEE domain-containing protein [Longimicrobiaceae bacterium]